MEAYQEITSQFQKSPNEDDPVFKPFLASPDIFKKIVTDSNVVAQESGIAALCAFLEYGGPSAATRLRGHVVPGLCEKGLSSSRAGTKAKTTEALLWLIELDTPDPVIELMLPSLRARLPKLVSGTVKALHEIYANFGAQTVNPKLVLPSLPKLFSHADRTVRAETSNLTVELYLWMGAALEQILFAELKPVQQKDLTASFEKAKEQKPLQKRYLKSQREAMEAAQENKSSGAAVDNEDVVMGNTEEMAPVDPYNMVDPVDVLSRLPPDLTTRVTAAKWKDRVEVLTETQKAMNVMKYADTDYLDLVRILAKCVKDVNIQVVSLAANCIELMAKGLRTKFQKYLTVVLNPLLERCKEKKPSVLDALNGALDAVFQSSSFSEVLPETLQAMKHKTPQVRLAACQYLVRLLKETTTAPLKSEIPEIIASAVKLVGDTLPDVRSCGFEAVGTFMKITGERELNPYLDSIDDIKMKKIKEFYENAEVKTKRSSSKPKPVDSSAPSRQSSVKSQSISKSTSVKRNSLIGRPAGSIAPSHIPSTSTLKKKTSSTIPSKRGPTSPLKNGPTLSRIGALGRNGLTGRSLQSSASSSLSHSISRDLQGMNDQDRTELEKLRLEKTKWAEEREKQSWQIEEAFSESSKLMKEIQALSSKVEKLNEQRTSDAMAIKSKETQLQRAQSDLEIARLKISQLENEIELIQKQRNSTFSSFSLETSSIPSYEGKTLVVPLQESNNTVRPSFVSKSIDGLDQRVSGLSIEGEHKENGLNRATLDTSDESWRRAAEVTSQLKQRIEKMKAKSRAASQRGL